MKVGIKLGKVKKFRIGWCIPHRVVADNTASNRVNQGTFPASIHIGTTQQRTYASLNPRLNKQFRNYS